MSWSALARRVEALLGRIVGDFVPAALACSLSAEGRVVTDAIARAQLLIDVLAIDTERLHADTLDLAGATEWRCVVRVELRSSDSTTITEFGFDAAIRSRRRDEKKPSAKERVFSFRDAFGQWDPRDQQPELSDLYDPRVAQSGYARMTPISNRTNLDVWRYMARERPEVPPLRHAHHRPALRRHDRLVPVTPLDTVPRRRGGRGSLGALSHVGDAVCTCGIEREGPPAEAIVAETGVATMLSPAPATRAARERGEVGCAGLNVSEARIADVLASRRASPGRSLAASRAVLKRWTARGWCLPELWQWSGANRAAA